MKTEAVGIQQLVHVTVDEDKFTPEFMEEFRKSFYNFHTLNEHIEHLGQMYARGIVSNFDSFIEGYGDPAEVGIKFASAGQDVEIVDL